jgi:hypothetical protein
MLESKFKREVFKPELARRFPGCVMINTDPMSFWGVPDLLVLFSGWKWAAFETKKGPKASTRSNQPYWINTLNKMGFARFVNPTNMEEVIYELEQALYKERPRPTIT